MSDVAELTARLVEIESINPNVVAGGSGERAVARFVAEWCERAGLETALEEAVPGRPNVIAVARGTGGGRALMLNAHMDTVGVAGMTGPFAPRVEGGRLYGRGAYDMKGSLAACMLATAEASRRRRAGDVMLTAVADEEFASVGTEAVARSLSADAAIVTEPTELQVAVAHRGFVHLEIETKGRAAHGSRPHLGVDAIAKMGRLLVAIEQLDASLRADPTHRYVGSGSVHASLIEGGQEYSSYPARCVLQAERRTIPGETVALVEGELQEIVARAAAGDPDFSAEVRVLASREPFEAAENSEIVTTVRRSAASVLGSEPDVVGVSFWADSALLAGAGIPTVLFGPSGEGAHAEVEWVDVESLERCVEIYAAVAGELCG
ncbi:MAG: M20/M25/M40 family metallo-hydrolase [Actinobacteria bacterium]|nr:M20/M25/M40 family metallo-hydrolase [Actinomycetota bacterium]